jgi:hypothetical protein
MRPAPQGPRLARFTASGLSDTRAVAPSDANKMARAPSPGKVGAAPHSFEEFNLRHDDGAAGMDADGRVREHIHGLQISSRSGVEGTPSQWAA